MLHNWMQHIPFGAQLLDGFVCCSEEWLFAKLKKKILSNHPCMLKATPCTYISNQLSVYIYLPNSAHTRFEHP